MPKCQCNCEGDTEGGDFLPGHDQKLRTVLEGRVGGLLVMRDLVEAIESYAQGRTTLEQLGQTVRQAFWRARGAV